MAKKLAYIIEDQEVDQKLLEANLNGMGLEAVLASNFLNILTEIKEFRPHIIVLDLNLDYSLQGLNILKQLQNSMLSDIPVLICSGDSTRDTILQLSKTGGLEFLLKPYSPQAFKEKVFRILRQSTLYQWHAQPHTPILASTVYHDGIITGVSELGVAISSFIKKSPDISLPIRCETTLFKTIGISPPVRINFLNNEGELHSQNLGVPYRTYCQAVGWTESERKKLKSWMKNKSVSRSF